MILKGKCWAPVTAEPSSFTYLSCAKMAAPQIKLLFWQHFMIHLMNLAATTYGFFFWIIPFSQQTSPLQLHLSVSWGHFWVQNWRKDSCIIEDTANALLPIIHPVFREIIWLNIIPEQLSLLQCHCNNNFISIHNEH